MSRLPASEIACSLIIALSILLTSCARTAVHVHDRHALSYPVIASFAKRHPGTTLVLVDYHHDVGTIDSSILSSNWVGKLLADGTISRALWVSGRDLVLPNRNARLAWLSRKLATLPPDESSAIAERLVLADWHELENTTFHGPLVVSFDLDVLCHDPGTPPERFLDEIASWTARQKPELVTVALSAAYQKDAASAWSRLARFVDRYGKDDPNAAWNLEAGSYRARAEGAEESAAWDLWEARKEDFGRRGASFLPAAAVWIAAPVAVRESLLGRSIRGNDGAAKIVISGWRDADLARLERAYPQARTDRLLAVAAETFGSCWRGDCGRESLAKLPLGEPCTPDESSVSGANQDSVGIAVRVQKQGVDRGCLSIIRGVRDPVPAAVQCARKALNDPRYPAVRKAERNDLDIEIAVMGPWRAMKGPFDFRPGLDSLLLVDGGETTLLQAPVAAERGLDRAAFLSRLSKKAGLGPDGWKNKGLRFERAATVWSRRSLVSIEAGNEVDYQKYEKK